MTEHPALFWSLAALLVALGMVFVLPTLVRAGRADRRPTPAGGRTEVYRDQLAELEADLKAGTLAPEDFENARRELAERLATEVSQQGPAAGPRSLPSRGVAWALALLLPVLAAALYLTLGTPEALVGDSRAAGGAPSSGEPVAGEPGEALERTLESLEAGVQERPADGEGWLLLGQRYVEVDRPTEAVKAFARACEFLPEDSRAWSGRAEALALSRGGTLDGEPMEMVYKALDLDSNDGKALELAGIYHFSHEDYGQAAYYWRWLLRQLPEDSPVREQIGAAEAEARRRARAVVEPPAGEAAGPVQPSPGGL